MWATKSALGGMTLSCKLCRCFAAPLEDSCTTPLKAASILGKLVTSILSSRDEMAVPALLALLKIVLTKSVVCFVPALLPFTENCALPLV